ncbi:MAG: phosphoribosylaminoimidazolesuccinocarboxamide synthase [Marivirga sp.]|nr:phosphoribosylaminoimidazolesuccinocarboxamide synthase [Marivirga sp.]
MEKVFKTKTGFCHVTEDQIILTRDGVVGSVAKVTVGNNISRILIIYGLISLGLFYFAYDSYLKNDTVTTVLFGLLGLYLIYGISKSLNNSATPIIERKDIKTTKFIKRTSGLSRSRFEIEFTEGGKIKKRLILLPGSMTNGQEEAKKAVEIMKEEKLLA